ncbi:hypothetical protein [Anaplasma bovis]|uniref:hypothetical protein n=1 Tax=Anaplasma bovis TaxID=186733 RepID=UPI002FF30707
MFSVDFLSPSRKVSFSDIVSLSARTDKGAFMIMANHEEAVMRLLSEVVEVKNTKGDTTFVNVSNAILSVKNNDCVVFTDDVSLEGEGLEGK